MESVHTICFGTVGHISVPFAKCMLVEEWLVFVFSIFCALKPHQHIFDSF